MEERYWKQFWETGKVTDYLKFASICDGERNPEREETGESDYSDRHGASGIAYR